MSRKTILVDVSNGISNPIRYIRYKDEKWIESEYVEKLKDKLEAAYREIEERDLEDEDLNE